MPICALQFGIASASLMKVISSIAYWITLLGKNVLGIASNALFSHIKSHSETTQKNAFHIISGIFTQALYGLGIFLLINGYQLMLFYINAPAQVTWSLLYFMLFLTFFENFFVIYEKWYILEEDTALYLFLNLISIGLLYSLTPFLTSPLVIVSIIIGVRVITYLFLVLISWYRWNILPSLIPHPLTLSLSLILSVTTYLILRL